MKETQGSRVGLSLLLVLIGCVNAVLRHLCEIKKFGERWFFHGRLPAFVIVQKVAIARSSSVMGTISSAPSSAEQMSQVCGQAGSQANFA